MVETKSRLISLLLSPRWHRAKNSANVQERHKRHGFNLGSGRFLKTVATCSQYSRPWKIPWTESPLASHRLKNCTGSTDAAQWTHSIVGMVLNSHFQKDIPKTSQKPYSSYHPFFPLALRLTNWFPYLNCFLVMICHPGKLRTSQFFSKRKMLHFWNFFQVYLLL